MTQSPRNRRSTRATRVALQGKISVIVLLENGRQFPAKLHQLSVTGGLLEVDMYLEERSKVGLTLSIGNSMVRPSAEMLFPMWSAQGYLQPFRFEHLWAEERQTLETEITELLKQTVARSHAGQDAGHRPRAFYSDSF
jgi:hypothetical protein